MIEEALFTIIKADTPVTDIIGTGNDARIYPNVAPQDVIAPYITTTRATTSPTDEKDVVSRLDVPQVDFDIWSDDHEESLDLAKKVRTALERKEGTFAGHKIDSIKFVNQIEDDVENTPEQLRYHQIVTFAIRHVDP